LLLILSCFDHHRYGMRIFYNLATPQVTPQSWIRCMDAALR
jgi:hypothetical protein